MKHQLLAGAGLLALAIAAQPAAAADLPKAPVVKAPVAVAPVYSWTGCYAGLQGGYGRGKTHHIFDGGTGTDAGSWTIDGALIGVTTGCNWQTANWVLGYEGDLAWSDISGDAPGTGCNTGNCFTDIRWFGTNRLRLGAATNNALWYVTGGLASARVKAGIASPADPDVTQTRWGWTVGAGGEWMLAPNWTAKLEYLYADLGDRLHYPIAGLQNTSVGVTTHIVRVGLNYRFSTGMPGMAAR